VEIACQYLGIDFGSIDQSALDLARFYKPNPEQKYWRIHGEPLPAQEIVDVAVDAVLEESRPAPMPIRRQPLRSGKSLIDAFNEANTVEALLKSYGYRERGNRWLSPFSSSGEPGVVILTGDDGKQRAVSHHDSDPFSYADAFDLFTIFEFQGDREAALQSLKKDDE
jgi:hypothetical protein